MDLDHNAPGSRRRGWWLVAIVVLIVWGLITHGTFAGSGDEPHYAMIAHSLAVDGDLDLTNDYRQATLIGGGSLAPGAHARVRDGRLRPVHDVGMPLVFAPVVAVAYSVAVRAERLGADVLRAARLTPSLLFRHQLSLAMALLTGLLAREQFLTLLCLRGGQSAAFWFALLFAVSPPVLSHAFLFFTEIPTALIALFVFRRLTLGGSVSPAGAVTLGALTSYLLVIHARNIGLVAGLALVALLIARERRWPISLLFLFAAGAATGVGMRMVTTLVLWDELFTTPHAALNVTIGLSTAVREISVRMTGLLFDREYGLIGYAPLYLLASPGLVLTYRTHSRLSRYVAIVLFCYLVPILLPWTNVHGWNGGWSPAARFLLPIAAFLWIPVYVYWQQAGRRGRRFALALVVVQLTIDATMWQWPKALWNDGDGRAAFRAIEWLPSWTTPNASLAFATAAAIAATLTYVCLQSARGRPTEDAR